MAPPQPNQPNKDATHVADPGTRIGHVHLKAADLERSIRFYSGVPRLQIMQRLGDSPAFLSAGGYDHPTALNTRESLGGPPPPPGATRLYHSAIVYPTRGANRLSHTWGTGRRVA